MALLAHIPAMAAMNFSEMEIKKEVIVERTFEQRSALDTIISGRHKIGGVGDEILWSQLKTSNIMWVS
jgi:hypothetical protein